MTLRVVIGDDRLRDPAGKRAEHCHECGTYVLVDCDRPRPGEVVLCRRCCWVCALRGLAWLWAAPEVAGVAARLRLPAAVAETLPDEIAAAMAVNPN